MGVSHFVPKGKVLVIAIGGYRFVGPVHAKLSGSVVLPETYEDGSPLENPMKDEKLATVPMPIGICPEMPEDVPISRFEVVVGSGYLI